jgi:hypothetical protein
MLPSVVHRNISGGKCGEAERWQCTLTGRHIDNARVNVFFFQRRLQSLGHPNHTVLLAKTQRAECGVHRREPVLGRSAAAVFPVVGALTIVHRLLVARRRVDLATRPQELNPLTARGL